MVATAEQKSQEEVAKSVKRISELLAMHGANPAQVKAQKKEDKELRNQEKDLLNKWVDVIDQQKKDLEKRTVKVSSMTSFIGLEAKKYFAETERNMVTWGGLAKSIGSGVKDWFNAAMKQNTMLGRTLRLGASLWKGVNDHIIGAIKNVFGKIAGHAREVLGELAEVFDVIKGVFMSMFRFLKDSFMGFFQRVPPHQRKRNKLLQKMVDFMRRREKRDFLEMGKTKAGNTGMWMILGMVIAALVGGMVRKFLLPFEITFKALRIGAGLKRIKSFFLSFSKFATVIFKIKSTIIKWARKLTGFISKMGAMGQALGKLGMALRFGFKFLGWPLTIILGIIDFIRGVWSSDAESLSGKIIDGLKAALRGFFELPVQLIGWIVEKVLGLFGIEVTGIADKIMGIFDWWWEVLFGFLKPILGFFEGFFSGSNKSFMDRVIAGFQGMWNGLVDMFNHIISIFPEDIQKSIIGFFVAIGDFFGILIDKFKGLLKWFGIEFDTPESNSTTMAPSKGDIMQVTQAEAAKYDAERDAYNAGVTGAIEKQTKKTIDAQEKFAKLQGDAMAVAITGGGGGGGSPGSTDNQIPDELDQPGMFGNGQFGGA